jgi:hypothetical protein
MRQTKTVQRILRWLEWFFGSLFNGAFQRLLDYIASNEGVISELWVGKDVEGSGRGLIFWNYPNICLEGQRKITRNFSRDMRPPGRDLSPGPPEYEVGVLTTTFGGWNDKRAVKTVKWTVFVQILLYKVKFSGTSGSINMSYRNM